MPIAKESGNFEPCPVGTHIARCTGCVALGTQHSEMFADSNKIMLIWELPHERIQTKDGADMPMTISKEYTLSLNKKATLRKHLDTWRGKAFTEEELAGFDVAKVAGAPCQLSIIHVKTAAGDVRARVEAVMGLAKGMTCPPGEHPIVKYELEMGQNDVFQALPEWIRKKILACEEWTAPAGIGDAPTSTGATVTEGEPVEDDVPF